MVESTGAELFTGNAAYLVVAVLEGKATLLGLLKNWSFTYLVSVFRVLVSSAVGVHAVH